MQIKESIRIALASIKSNRMRSLLTMLGIIIGISSVITISAIGSSLKSFIEEELKGVGYEMVELSPNWSVIGDYIPDECLFTRDEADALCERFDKEIVYCAPYSSLTSKVRNGRRSTDVFLMGANSGLDRCDPEISVVKGRFISDKDVKKKSNVVVIDERAAKEFLGNSDPIGKTLQFDMGEETADFKVVGVYREKQSKIESLLGGSGRYRLYTPYSVIVGTDYAQMYLEFYLDTKEPDKIADQMVSYVSRIKRMDEGSFMQQTAASEMETINKVMDVISLAIAAIAAISLIVGGIGIMNIMLVSVTERTKEIGIRKALGARTKDIMRQFLIEAIILSCIGGIIGIILGVAVAGLVATILEAKLVVSVTSVAISVAFSIIVGIVFGIFPARKAARMNPIDALRCE